MTNRTEPTSRHYPTALLRLTTGLALALGLMPAAGCYTGLDPEPAAADDGADDGGAAADGADANDDGPTPRQPSEPEPDDPFNVPTDEARLLPFPVRMDNLAHVVGQDLQHPMFLELYELRYQLGDHDYASGVASDLRWSSERMQYWVRGLKPVCDSPQMRERYPDLLADARPLMRQAWGHEPAADEVEAIADLQGGALPLDEQYTVTCIAVLTSLDFVSI
ncbi:MAG: hypothetical protein AB1Z98_06810 [Nannocystaceae bacterium]